MPLTGGRNLQAPFVSFALFGQKVTSFWLFWYFLEDFTSWGRALFAHLGDFTSWGRALFGTLGGFHVLGASTFWDFWRISRPGGEHFLHFFVDFTSWGRALLHFLENFRSWGRALFALFGGFQVLGLVFSERILVNKCTRKSRLEIFLAISSSTHFSNTFSMSHVSKLIYKSYGVPICFYVEFVIFCFTLKHSQTFINQVKINKKNWRNQIRLTF